METSMTRCKVAAPKVVPVGTISGRTVEPLFATLPSHYDHPKIYAEIKSTFQCPDGLTFIGFDFSAQELQVASLFADVKANVMTASSELGVAILSGDKSNKTDLHSLTAERAEIPRTIAKNLNYGFAYGCGVKTATNTVKQGLAETELDKAPAFAKAGLKAFKGKKNEWGNYEGGVASDYFNYVYEKSAQSHPSLDLFGQKVPNCLARSYIGKSGSPAQI